MVDRLKQSLEQLEPPVCPNCHLDMSWYRSALMSESPVTIAHLFTCPNCGGTAETRSSMPRTVVPPPKLSAPRSELQAA
jgi:predicted RNA-binding Zn-ribbon protein involved in translation (DUF1610 family)